VADDAVDRDPEPAAALARMRQRLDAIYGGAPADDPVDRALAAVVVDHGLSRAPFDWMLEGFAWDLEGRRYETLSDLRAYCVRVAGTVGVVMTELMGERRAPVLARACDLGVGMQLTNIARDVGEDAREGRLYLPQQWLREAGVEPERFVEHPRWSPPIGLVTRRLLAEAAPLYARADHGIRLLPLDCRVAIRAARLVYADIGRVIEDHGFDSVTDRAYTSGTRKTVLIGRAMGAATWRGTEPSAEPALPEARPLVEAVSRGDT